MTAVPAPRPSTALAVVGATLSVLLATALRRVRRARPAAGPALDVLGLAAVSVGAFLLATWLGWVVVGAALLVLRHVLLSSVDD